MAACHSSDNKSALTKVIWAFVLALISMIFGMPGLFGQEATPITASASGLAAFVSLFLFGRHFLRDIPKLFHAATMNTLVGLGVVAAFSLSLFNLLSVQSFEIYFESAAFIIAFVLFGQFLEAKIQDRMNRHMRGLTEVLPKRARRLLSDGEEEVAIDQLKIGDRILVRVGERLAVDAKILSDGEYQFDEAVVTGESGAVSRGLNDKVPQGALVVGQPVELEVTALSGDSLVEQLAKEVQKTLQEKPKIQKTVDRVTKVFVPLVVLIAGFSAFYWYRKAPGDDTFILTSVSVLVIACPCALGMATPTAIFVGALRAARNGFLLKSLDAVEKASEITTVAFDKTGTLTKGRPQVTGFKTGENIAHKDLLRYALTLEQKSEHPYAEAILKKAKEDGLKPFEMKDGEIVPGKGVRGTVVDGNKTHAAIIGSLYFLMENGFEKTDIPADFEWEEEGSGKTTLWVGVDQKFFGLIFLGDELRAEASSLVTDLSNKKYDVGMITGDTQYVAEAVQKKLGLKFIHAGVLPHEKAALIRKLSEPRKKGIDMLHPKVAFVGDGVNDAPALAQAHLGIAMGSGTSLSQSAADIVLVSNRLNAIVVVFDLLKMTRRLIRENLLLSFVYNALAIPIAAGVLIPFYGLSLSPKIAALAMALSSLSVLLNSSRRLQ